jgi:predicted metal-binding membrane protein
VTTDAGSVLVDRLLRRDRLLVALGLATLAALAWAYIIEMRHSMSSGASALSHTMVMPMSSPMQAPGLLWLIPMWIVMMLAMMIPSAAPAILLYAGVARQRRARGAPTASAAVFTLGYLLVWALYASIAAILQWQLNRLALLSPDMASASPFLGGTLLILAGVYQWAPVKKSCLSHCRSPLGFFAQHWREGTWGALWSGMHHGTYCVGCCWALMALLFFAGVMNLLWVVAIALFVLAEKLVPQGPLAGRIAGLLLIGWGSWIIAWR